MDQLAKLGVVTIITIIMRFGYTVNRFLMILINKALMILICTIIILILSMIMMICYVAPLIMMIIMLNCGIITIIKIVVREWRGRGGGNNASCVYISNCSRCSK